MAPTIFCSCQRAAVRARPGETGRLWRGRPADGYTDQEGNLCGYTVLDGSRGHPAVRLRLQGKGLHRANCLSVKIFTADTVIFGICVILKLRFSRAE